MLPNLYQEERVIVVRTFPAKPGGKPGLYGCLLPYKNAAAWNSSTNPENGIELVWYS